MTAYSNKNLVAAAKSVNAYFNRAVDAVPEADRFPLQGFTPETVEALKRIHPKLTALSHNVEVVFAFKNGGCRSSWLTHGRSDDHHIVKSAVNLFAQRVHFKDYQLNGYQWTGLVKFHICDFELASCYAVIPGAMDENFAGYWHWLQVMPEGYVLETKEPVRTPH
jgi:hypothetical protein